MHYKSAFIAQQNINKIYITKCAFWGQGIHIFTHIGEKTKEKSFYLMTEIFGGSLL